MKSGLDGGFSDNANLMFFEQEEDIDKKSVRRKMRVEFAVQELLGRLDMPESKMRDAWRIYEQVSTNGFDALILAGSLIHVVSRQRPLHARWKNLVAKECRELGREENRLMKRYSDLYYDKNIVSGVNRIKNAGYETEPVTALDYAPYIFQKTGCGETVQNFVNRNAYFLDSKAEWQSKSKVGLVGSLVYVGKKRFTDAEMNFEELAESLCMDEKTFEDYVGILEDTELR